MIYLYLKTHRDTGLKYLGKTIQNPYEYGGSGDSWRKHLKKNGNNVSTLVLYMTEDKREFKKVAKFYSEIWNVVESRKFANIRPEEGDGGKTDHLDSWKEGMKNRRSYSGENNPNYGKEGCWAGKVGPNIGKKMWNNGKKQVFAVECPEGFVHGRLPGDREKFVQKRYRGTAA